MCVQEELNYLVHLHSLIRHLILALRNAGLYASHRVPIKDSDQTGRIRPFKEKSVIKITIIFLPINLSICFGCSKEPSHRAFT